MLPFRLRWLIDVAGCMVDPGLQPQLPLGRFLWCHLLAGAFSRDVEWALARRVRRGCMEGERSLLAPSSRPLCLDSFVTQLMDRSGEVVGNLGSAGYPAQLELLKLWVLSENLAFVHSGMRGLRLRRSRAAGLQSSLVDPVA